MFDEVLELINNDDRKGIKEKIILLFNEIMDYLNHRDSHNDLEISVIEYYLDLLSSLHSVIDQTIYYDILGILEDGIDELKFLKKVHEIYTDNCLNLDLNPINKKMLETIVKIVGNKSLIKSWLEE